jgi:hypothetical protein
MADFCQTGPRARDTVERILIVALKGPSIHTLRLITMPQSLAKVYVHTILSLWVRQSQPGLTGFHWQAGYAAFSVSQSSVEAVRGYIRNQADHHRKQSFQEELRDWLRRYEIEWDERYLWD